MTGRLASIARRPFVWPLVRIGASKSPGEHPFRPSAPPSANLAGGTGPGDFRDSSSLPRVPRSKLG